MTLKNLTFRRPLYDDRSFAFFAFLRFCHPLHPKFRQNLSCGSDVLSSLNCFSDLNCPLWGAIITNTTIANTSIFYHKEYNIF